MSFWPFSNKCTLAESGLFQGMTDWHCHILPGVDDGVQTMDEALSVLAYYEHLGFSEVWLTPHIMEDMPNKTADLRHRFSELQAAYRGGIKLHLAAENMIDSLFDQRLEAGDLLTLGDGNRLLVETSYFNSPMAFLQRVEHIKARGYTPVLAHPERYVYMDNSFYQKLRDMGVAFQLNIVSLTGMYGKMAKKKAEHLLAAQAYTLAGTDLHSQAAHRRQFAVAVEKSIIESVKHAAKGVTR